MSVSNPPHHTLACNWKSTTCASGAGGCEYSNIPAPRMSTPLISSEMPMKNQMETDLPVVIGSCLPENDIQHKEYDRDHRRPEQRLLIPRDVTHRRNFRLAIDQAGQCSVRQRLCRQTHHDRHRD